VKYIIAIIQPQRLDPVREALAEVGVKGLTVSDVQGYGRQKGHTEVYRGHEYLVNFVRKVKVEVACDSEAVEQVIETITRASKSGAEGKIGDGKIFILDLADAVRIRTGERGQEAI